MNHALETQKYKEELEKVQLDIKRIRMVDKNDIDITRDQKREEFLILLLKLNLSKVYLTKWGKNETLQVLLKVKNT